MFKIEHNKMPKIVRLELTNTCNLKCPHCRHHSAEKRNSPEYPEYYRVSYHMTRDQIDKIFDEIGPYKPSFTLNAANEPMIAKEFKYAVEQVKKWDCSGTFNTNGLLLNRENSEFLVDQKFDSVNISIDATTPETLKKARGITALDKLIRNVKLLHEIRGSSIYPRIGVTFVVMPYNESEINDFLNFWKDIADVIRLTGYISDKKPDMSVLPGFKSYKVPPRVPCKQIFRDLVIRADGTIAACIITGETPENFTMGNIFKDGGIKKVWNGEKFKEWRDKHNSGRWNELDYCKGCDYWVESYDFKEKEFDDFIIRSPSPYTVFYNVKKTYKNWDQEKLIDRQGLGKEKFGKIDTITSFDI
jgi:radical SAM protein with 4Fe4S-binding SPASM domain